MHQATEAVLAGLGYKASDTQTAAIQQVTADLGRRSGRMKRVLLGDVGSGKTTVALAAAVEAKARYPDGQVVYMAPTRDLATQTRKKMRPHLDRMRMKTSYLASKSTSQQRTEAKDADVVFATHAFLSDKVSIRNVVLLIIDEQQRFGVEHRALAASKSGRTRKPCHLLVLSATPIPRTTEQLTRGVFDVTAIDRHTPNRTTTVHVKHDDTARCHPDVLREIRERVRRRQRVFVVYAAVDVDKNDNGRLADLQTGALQIRRAVGRDKVVTAHGRMTPDERDEAFDEFRRGRALVLAATTVIEVGIDIPDARCIVVHNAESFGAAQLHQLRGRVGRDGSPDALCMLVSMRQTQKGSGRIESVKRNSDGFKIFEDDRRARGPGNPNGTEQKGHDHKKEWDKNGNKAHNKSEPGSASAVLSLRCRQKCLPSSSRQGPKPACKKSGRTGARPKDKAKSTSTAKSRKRTTTPCSVSSKTTRSTTSSRGRTRPRPATPSASSGRKRTRR